MKKRLLVILIIISVFVLQLILCSCNKENEDLNNMLSPENKSIIDLADYKYDDSELSAIVDFNGSLYDLNNKHSIYCLRNDGNNYRVSYLGNDKIAVIIFDYSGNRVFGNIYLLGPNKSEFDKVEKGQSLEEIMKLDENGDYTFLYTGRNIPRVSTHYTKDGYLINIEYDDSNSIISTTSVLI